MTSASGFTPDPEIAAMQAIAGALAELDPAATSRVLRWASDRYDVVFPVSTSRKDGRMAGDDSDAVSDSGVDVDSGEAEHESHVTVPMREENDTFDHFAELYDAAEPKTDAEKLLVAAYWHTNLGNETFGSQPLNAYLKDLGHGVTHISERMEQLIKAKPALVLQTRKAGKTAQARKTYKMTTSGATKVRRMISGND